MPEAESALEVATEELPIPVPEIEDEAETEQEYVPPTQTDSIPVQPTQPEPKSAPESIANDNELADMVYVPGFGWIESQGPNQSRVRRGYVRERQQNRHHGLTSKIAPHKQ